MLGEAAQKHDGNDSKNVKERDDTTVISVTQVEIPQEGSKLNNKTDSRRKSSGAGAKADSTNEKLCKARLRPTDAPSPFAMNDCYCFDHPAHCRARAFTTRDVRLARRVVDGRVLDTLRDGEIKLKKNLANKIFGYLARCEGKIYM